MSLVSGTAALPGLGQCQMQCLDAALCHPRWLWASVHGTDPSLQQRLSQTLHHSRAPPDLQGLGWAGVRFLSSRVPRGWQ